MKWLTAGIAALVIAFSTGAQAQKPEVTKVRLAVGGKSSLYYLPLTITERLGYFKEAGLDVEISDFAGGAKSLQALIGGSADVVTGSQVAHGLAGTLHRSLTVEDHIERVTAVAFAHQGGAGGHGHHLHVSSHDPQVALRACGEERHLDQGLHQSIMVSHGCALE